MIAQHKGRDGQVPAHDAKRMVRALQNLLARAALGKKLDPVLGACAVVPGKMTAEKLNELLGFWSKAVDGEFPNLDFAKAIEDAGKRGKRNDGTHYGTLGPHGKTIQEQWVSDILIQVKGMTGSP